jgi:hypothetical protein
MAKRPQLKTHHYYGGAAILVAVGLAFYLGVIPSEVMGGGPGKAPVISAISAANVTASTADISWTTDTPSNDFVCWTSFFSPKKKDQRNLSWECAGATVINGNTKTAKATNLSAGIEYTYFVTAMNVNNEHKDTKSDFLKFSTPAL